MKTCVVIALVLGGVASACQNIANWKHGRRGCVWAASKPNRRCRKSGDADGVEMTAAEACCGCGGGGAVTPEPTPRPTPSCQNIPNWKHGRRGCFWAASKPNQRCRKSGDADGVEMTAAEACCGCGGGGAVTPEPTPSRAQPCFPTPSTTAERTQCMAGQGAWNGLAGGFCTICCPSCAAIDTTVDTSSFFNSFVDTSIAWIPKEDFEGCACLILEQNNFNLYGQGAIHLTEGQDCVRVTGNTNWISGEAGDDAMYIFGEGNVIFGGEGDDHLVMSGETYVNDGAKVYGGEGDDVCQHRWTTGKLNLFDCEVAAFLTWPLPPTPSTAAQRTECMAGQGVWTGLAANWCDVCCPSCAAIDTTVDTSSFFNSFVDSGIAWTPKEDFEGCACLILEQNNFNLYGQGAIHLTDGQDCVRVTGNTNWISGEAGDDAMYIFGEGNVIFGGEGDDHLVMSGETYVNDGAKVYGGEGDDVCQHRWTTGKVNIFDCEVAKLLTWGCDALTPEPTLETTPEPSVSTSSPGPTSPPPTAVLTKEEKEQCFRGLGRFAETPHDCRTCCAECAPFDSDTFEATFVGSSAVALPTGGCACLDLAVSNFGFSGFSSALRNRIELTDGDDCLRLEGDFNRARGNGGDDVLVALGYGNRLDGLDGDDVLTAAGDENILDGDAGDDKLTITEGSGGEIFGDGGDDLCTDLGDNEFSNEILTTAYFDCETCVDGTGSVNCATRLPAA